MRPYRYRFPSLPKSLVFSLVFVITLGVTPAEAGSAVNRSEFDALTQSGFEHFYSLEYDLAIRDFQKALEARPDEPKALNHFLVAMLLQQLYSSHSPYTPLYRS